MDDANIVLIGFMGCGKTTFGEKLASKLGWEFVDTDQKIESEQNMTISQIFEQKGEPYFRTLEKETVFEFSKKKMLVIATGGGMIKNPQNMNILGSNGKIVFLKASPEQIYHNIGYDENRPLLKGTNKMERICSLMAERRPLYEKFADFTVEMTGKGTDQVMEELLRITEEKK